MPYPNFIPYPNQYPQAFQQPYGEQNYNNYNQSNQQPVTQTAKFNIAGKFVNTVNEILPQDVPMDGSRSVFPTYDGNTIFVKYWNPDGTISTVKYDKADPIAPLTDSSEDSKWGAIRYELESLSDRVKKLENNSYKNRSKSGQGYGGKPKWEEVTDVSDA